MIITTTYKTNKSGTGQILAKGNGRQRTVNYDQAASPERNHGAAAGVLALALIAEVNSGMTADTINKAMTACAEKATHKVGDDGRHHFTI